MKLRVAIAGASGYVGGELARVIENHPNLELVTVTQVLVKHWVH